MVQDALVERLETAIKKSYKKEDDLHDSLEDLAHETSLLPQQDASSVVQKVVTSYITSPDTQFRKPALQFLAWLLLYDVIDPLQILQALIYTKDFSMLKICGTSRFEKDVMTYLKLHDTKGKETKFGKSSSKNILIDLLAESQDLKRTLSRTNPSPYEEGTKSPRQDHVGEQAAKRNKVDLSAYEARIRKIIMSSMSAEEAAHKVLGIYAKDTQINVAKVILKAAYEAKMYNRIYGLVAKRVFQNNSRLWRPAWGSVFVRFFTEDCEAVDADRLKAAGKFFGHLLSMDVIDWNDAFRIVVLDAEHSTPSSRILILAVLTELKESLGTEKVERRLMSDELSGAVDGVLKTELAAGFWDLAGYASFAAKLSERNENSSEFA